MMYGASSAEACYPAHFSAAEYVQLQDVINACDVGLCMLDEDLRVQAWNRHLAEMTGKADSEVLGLPLGSVLPELADPGFVNRIHSVLQFKYDEKDATPLLLNLNGSRHCYRTKDNFFRCVSVKPLVQHPRHCLVQIYNVEAETVLEEQIRNTFLAEQRSIAMLSSIEDAVILLDGEGRIEFANLAAEGMTGFLKREMAGRPLTEIYQVFNEAGDTRSRLNYSQIVQVDNRPLFMMHREGLTFPIEQSLTRLKGAQGQLEGMVVVFKDVSQSRKLAAQLNWQASHDVTTRLYNRLEFDRRLTQLLEEAEMEGSRHCLLYLDIDRFKVVNDSCGYMAGDELLRQAGSLMKRAIRNSDLLARLGGDEFAILLSSCTLEVALRIADTIRMEFQRFRFVWGEMTFSQSVSIGLASIDKQSEGLQQVLSFADSACFAAKEAGRNQVHVYQQDKSIAALRHGEAQWVTRIRKALDEDRFALYVQPIHALSAERKGQRHYEVLIRMIDESGGLIPPGAFIPAAERYDLMPAIDRWVVHHVVTYLVENQPACINQGSRLFVNLSGQSLCSDETLQTIMDLLRQHPLQEGMLCFEVTETATISNLSSAKHFMRSLKHFGCDFALDDFGSGLSSFGYLKHMAVEYLKIDGSFVKDMERDEIDESMVDAINRIGHIMGLETIAECVENDEILQRLIDMGIDYGQGYGIVRPFPIETLLS